MNISPFLDAFDAALNAKEATMTRHEQIIQELVNWRSNRLGCGLDVGALNRAISALQGMYPPPHAPTRKLTGSFVIRHNYRSFDRFMPKTGSLWVFLESARRFSSMYAACTALQQYLVENGSDARDGPYSLEIMRVIEEAPQPVVPKLSVEQIT
jgi:hypothetical protein